jgi:hypothetical protein
MPTDPGAPVQAKSGTGLGTEGITPVVASLDSAITEGNTILILVGCVNTDANDSTPPELSAWPEGFNTDFEDNFAQPDLALMALSRVAGLNEPTTWDLTPFGTDKRVSWCVLEWDGLPGEPSFIASSVNAFSATAGVAFGAGTTPALGYSGTLQVALFSHVNTGTWSGYTAGFTERADTNTLPSFAVATAYSTSPAAATCSAAPSSTQLALAALIVYRVADADFDDPPAYMNGFEIGTHNGLLNTTNPSPAHRACSSILGTVGTDISVHSATPPGPWSAYYLHIVQAGAAKYFRVDSTIFGTQYAAVKGFHIRVVSSTGLVVLAEIYQTAGGTSTQLVYDTATSKLGVRWNPVGASDLSGAELDVAWQVGTTPPGTWVWVDWRVLGFGGPNRRTDWYLDGVEQPSPVLRNFQTVSAVGHFNWGANVAQTVTFDVDDSLFSGVGPAFPYTKHHVRLLTVDPAGTPSISGTSANFSVFTANTTLAAWNAANARNALDERPPTISASADGVCQTVSAASDYAAFPMATYKLPSSRKVTGVRMWAAAWGGTGAGAGTMEIRGHDGAAEASLFPAGTAWDPDSITTPSATVPPWVTAQWHPAGGWDQVKLDAAVLRVGFSSDATPDMGVHCLYLEAAIRANDPDMEVLAWRVDYTNGTSRESAAGAPVVTTGVRGVVLWHTPPYRTLDYGWDFYEIAGVLLTGELESEETYEVWRTALYDEPHPLG